jgi:hypothetical protein
MILFTGVLISWRDRINIVNTLTQYNFYTATRHIEKSDYLCQTLLSDIDENYSANMLFLVHFDRIKIILY